MSGQNGNDPKKRKPRKRVPAPVPERRIVEPEYAMGYCDRCGGETIHKRGAYGYECTRCM